MMKALQSVKSSDDLINALKSPEMQEFISQHAQILDKSFETIQMSESMRKDLQRYDYIFSGIKTFHELHESFPSLIDENGNRKPFNRFLMDVQTVHETYNKNWLQAEYNFAQSSARMADKWDRFVQDGDRYNLQYRTAGDDRVRPPHAVLNRITLPLSSPFWQWYFPPNGWNCRCNVVQVLKDKYTVTPLSEAMERGKADLVDDKKGMFRFNSGALRQTFPHYHPYTLSKCNTCPIAKGKEKTQLAKFIPDNEVCAACKLVRQCAADKSKSQRAIERTHYLHEMEPLLSKKVTVTGNGHDMPVRFTRFGNKHLYSDSFGRTRNLDKEDLKNMDKILASAKFIKKAELGKKRKDDLKRFYYYESAVRGNKVYLNVAEMDKQNAKGKIMHIRFLYSITDKIKQVR